MTSKQTVYRVVVDIAGKVLFEEPYEACTHEMSYLRRKDAVPVFPKQLYYPGMSFYEICHELNRKLDSGEILHHWKYSIPAKELCYVRYNAKTIESGCEHFQHGVLFVCNCGETFACKYCHYDCSYFGVKTVICAACKLDIGDRTECCGRLLYRYLCRKCAVASMYALYSHCDICGCVNQSVVKHCAQCNHCVLDDNHLCQAITEESCPICFEHYDYLLLRAALLDCGHMMHYSCYDRMEREGQISCPFDRQTVSITSSEPALFNRFIGIYSMTEIPASKIDEYVIVQCYKCHKQQVYNWHPHGYICCHCMSIKSIQKERFSGTAYEAREIVAKQYELFATTHNRRPIYPLILFPKDGNEMRDVVDCYLERYRPFWEELYGKLDPENARDTPLSEVFLAYMLTRVYDENFGFAALNLMHSRQIFPEDPRGLDQISIDSIVEVRELNKIGFEK